MTIRCFPSLPQEMTSDKVSEWLPLEGWVATERPFHDMHLVFEHGSEHIASLTEKRDRNVLPPEFSSKFLRTFKSVIPVREMLGEREAGTIILKVLYEDGRNDLVPIEMPRYKFRKEKAAKVERFAPLMACPYCKTGVVFVSGRLRCGVCDRSFPFTGNSFNFLTDDLKKDFSIVPTNNVSDCGVEEAFRDIIVANPGGFFLDFGSGFKTEVFPNLINFEIVDYPSTDVLGVGERLPFLSGSIDGIYCNCVLEHVKDPFACAGEIMRVLKPGGYLHCTVPFLQPVHAYPNHFYNMTQQGLVNLFHGMEIREAFVPEHLHPLVSLSWILKAYFTWLPEKEKAEFADMTVRDLLLTFPMGSNKLEHPIRKALPKDKLMEIASGNTVIAVKPGAPCNLNAIRKLS